MYWVMMSERSSELELSLDGTPPLIERHDWRFDLGLEQAASLPVIDVPVSIRPDEHLTDNIPAYGCRGLLINGRVRAVFEGLRLGNVQYYNARLVDRETGQVLAPFWIANIVGRSACVDHDRSDIDYHPDGDIRFIDRLALTPMADEEGPCIFRLAEFLPAMIANDAVKDAIVEHRITGFRFYRPEDFSL